MILYQFTTEQIEEIADAVKKTVIAKLTNDGALSLGDYNRYNNCLMVHVRKKSWWQKTYNRFLGEKNQKDFSIGASMLDPEIKKEEEKDDK